MKLYIDTSNIEIIKVGLDDEMFETSAKKQRAQKILPFIEKVLKKNRKKLNDIKEIKVNTGPGSYTGLRVGVSVAQALGWTLDIPVNGKDLTKGEKIEIKYE